MTPGRRGFYDGLDKEGRPWRIPRNVDPAQDGISLAAGHKPIFSVDDAPDSVPIEEFDRRMEAAIPKEVIARIDHVISAGKFLAAKGLADQPPLEEQEWRRGMILSWSHARDLEVVHDAIGHPRLLAGRHDVDEIVLAKHLKATVAKADPWYRDYIGSLDDGAWVNVGFFNPHISASLHRWGDAKLGIQNAMDAHRFAAHHQGSPEAPLDWVERAVNFVVHHVPREHWGIRHERRGGYDELEERLATDSAIKDASIGKVIARDAAQLYQLLEAEGMVVPWGLLKLPDNDLTPSVIEHAFHVSQAAREEEVGDAIEPRRMEWAQRVLSRLPEQIAKVRAEGRGDLAAAYERFMNTDG